MNAHALLTSQGWLGSGHALDSRLTDYGAPTYKQKGKRGLAYESGTSTPTITSGNGLVKPLLVSQRNGPGGRYGIGKKAHEPASGTEWWLKGFQSALANIGKSEEERTVDTTPVAAGKHGGLYGHFVAGQMMQGTIEEHMSTKGKKRRSDVLQEDDGLAVKPVKRVQTARELESSIPYLQERDKTRRKKHERAISTDVEQFAVVGQFLGAADGKKEKGDVVVHVETRAETKEERSARRRRRKEDKERGKLSLAQMVEEELAKLSSLNNSEADAAEDSTSDRARRKAEKKSRRSKKTEPQ